jgi:hypothetical protein
LGVAEHAHRSLLLVLAIIALVNLENDLGILRQQAFRAYGGCPVDNWRILNGYGGLRDDLPMRIFVALSGCYLKSDRAFFF